MSTELYSKRGAVANWLIIAGLLLFVAHYVFVPTNTGLSYTAGLIVIAGFLLGLYVDWKAGNKNSVRRRLLFFVAIIILAFFLYFIR